MTPFARRKQEKFGRRKLLLLSLAATSLSIWYFDLVPELAPVPSGELQTAGEESFDENDFLELLKADPDAAITAGQPESTNSADASGRSTAEPVDPLLAAFESQSDPEDTDAEMPDGFAEFGLTDANRAADDSDSAPNAPQAAAGGIQQASYSTAAVKSAPPAHVASKEPVVLPAGLADQLRQIDQLVAANEILKAHAALSQMYWKQPKFRRQLLERLNQTSAEIYANPNAHFAEPRMVDFGETLEGIAREYKVPWQYLARLNRTSPEKLQAGQKLKVLTGPFGAIVDLDEFEMTIHAHGWFVRRYDIGIGADQGTPIGVFTVENKLENPTWYNPDGGVVDADDPNNPLGEYWLGLGNHIGIHGTINPESIGRAQSRGCVHLADGDIAEVFQLLDVGSEVRIRR